VRPQIFHHIWSLGVGGDAKNLIALAKLQQKEWAEVSVLTKLEDAGPRTIELQEAGIKVFPAIAKKESMKAWLKNNPSAIGIFHRYGRPDKQETELIKAAYEASVRCFEYNIFARVDKTTESYWSGHAHLSRTSMLQYANRAKQSPKDLVAHAAIGFAVDIPTQVTKEERLFARHDLNIGSDQFVVLRLSRPDLRKWDPLPVLAFSRLINESPDYHLIIMSPPPVRNTWITSKLGGNVSILPPSTDKDKLRKVFAASDCLVNYSHIGETFGLALAEGMAYGLPVIVNSTPGMDNAQIELCQNGKTGLVANTLRSLTDALRYLRSNAIAREKLGLAGKTFTSETFDAPIVEARLRSFIKARLEASASQSETRAASPLNFSSSQTSLVDNYVLDENFTQHFNKHFYEQFYDQETKTETAQSKKVSLNEWPSEYLKEQLYLWFLRTKDSLDYALSLEKSAILKSIVHRLKTGSLRR
jgi:glycosyltransferase involved in cell wall biosynthesis